MSTVTHLLRIQAMSWKLWGKTVAVERFGFHSFHFLGMDIEYELSFSYQPFL